MRVAPSLLRWGTLVVLVLLLTLAVSACGGGEEAQPEAAEPGQTTGDTALPAPGEQARLRCGESCASHGNCGNTLNQGLYVLLDRDRPVAAAGQHDMAVPAETVVTVREIRPQTVVSPSGEERAQNFFRVLVPERNEEAWVANWCLVQVP